MTALSLKGVAKRFGSTEVLRTIDLTVAKGTFFALLGASGSGKTTLLRCVAGFEVIDGGTIEIAGRVVDDPTTFVPPERRRVGYVSQDGSLFPHLSVERNVLFGVPRATRTHELAEGLLEGVGLSGFGTRRPAELSGGQRQRVALARALALNPTLVLLDEPFSALDAALRSEVRDQVAAVLHAHGATTILVTHDQDEALSMADRVAVLRDGTIVQEDEPAGIYRQPVDVATAAFVGEANVLQGTKQGSEVATVLGAVTVANAAEVADGAVEVVLRPEQLSLAEGPASSSLRVARHRYHGHEAMTHVTGPGGLELVVRHDGTLMLSEGSAVSVKVNGVGLAFEKSSRNTDS
jgi:iron(III) transport system ATP-binding protein